MLFVFEMWVLRIQYFKAEINVIKNYIRQDIFL